MGIASARPDLVLAPAEQAAYDRLEALARLLDTALRVPGTEIRVGLDAILNVVPGIGTLAAKGLGAYLVWEARRLGVPIGTMARMLGNLGIDLAISAIPLLGWVGDVFFRANRRNMDLLRAHLGRHRRSGGPVYGDPPYRGPSYRGPVIEGQVVRAGGEDRR